MVNCRAGALNCRAVVKLSCVCFCFCTCTASTELMLAYFACCPQNPSRHATHNHLPTHTHTRMCVCVCSEHSMHTPSTHPYIQDGCTEKFTSMSQQAYTLHVMHASAQVHTCAHAHTHVHTYSEHTHTHQMCLSVLLSSPHCEKKPRQSLPWMIPSLSLSSSFQEFS